MTLKSMLVGEPSPSLESAQIREKVVSVKEIYDLEERLQELYLELAKYSRKRIIVITDEDKYQKLRDSGALFEEGKNAQNLYLLMDQYHQKIKDMTPIVYHLMHTQEGKFYAQYLTQHGDLL